jgi:uncharacterized protein (TIGR04222 family)
MFPFDLPGPQFLVFYALFAIAVFAALHLGRRHLESGPAPSLDLKDPLLFACLRGGPKETLSVATLGLIDRGLLHATGRTITPSSEAKPELVSRRIEKELLNYFRQAGAMRMPLNDAALLRVASEEYEEQLRRHRLVPDPAMLRTRLLLLIAALAALLGVGGIKLAVALSAGRTNVGFLIIMMTVAVFLAFKSRGPYRTALGDSHLASIRNMFTGLRERASSIRPGDGSRELLWLTALFGIAALPTSAFPFVPELWPKSTAAAAATSNSGCGSSCGGGGSGCGGGGGGGCGGCGSG